MFFNPVKCAKPQSWFTFGIELERNLSPDSRYQLYVDLFKHILNQIKSDKNKIYSVHEPADHCISIRNMSLETKSRLSILKNSQFLRKYLLTILSH